MSVTHTMTTKERLFREIETTPEELCPNLLKMVQVFKESILPQSPEASFHQGWSEALKEETLPLLTLWEGLGEKQLHSDRIYP